MDKNGVGKGRMMARKAVCFLLVGMSAWSFLVLGIPLIGMFFLGSSVYLWDTYVGRL